MEEGCKRLEETANLPSVIHTGAGVGNRNGLSITFMLDYWPPVAGYVIMWWRPAWSESKPLYTDTLPRDMFLFNFRQLLG